MDPRRHRSATVDASSFPSRRAGSRGPEDVVDVFVYVTVLNLAVEHVPAVISEGFTLSLLTAVLLKLSLELVLVVKHGVLARLRRARTVRAKLAAGLLLWLAAAGSKLAVLASVDLIFGDAVSLGGFVSVTLLVAVLLTARAAVRRLLSGHAATHGEPRTGITSGPRVHGPRPQDRVPGGAGP